MKNYIYNLTMPVPLHEEIKAMAELKQTTFKSIFIELLKIGLLVSKTTQKGDKFLIEENGKTREILIK